MDSEYIGVFLFFIIGFAILFMAIYWFVKLRYKIKSYDVVQGFVRDYRKTKFLKIGSFIINYTYSAIIEYTHPIAGNQTYVDPLSTFWRRFKSGQEILLFVDPNNKVEPIMDNFLSKYLGIIIFCFIGIIFSWSSIAYLLGWENVITH